MKRTTIAVVGGIDAYGDFIRGVVSNAVAASAVVNIIAGRVDVYVAGDQMPRTTYHWIRSADDAQGHAFDVVEVLPGAKIDVILACLERMAAGV